MTPQFFLAVIDRLAVPVAAQTALRRGSDALIEAPAQSIEYVIQIVQPSKQNIGTITVTETIVDGPLVIIPMAGANQSDSTVIASPSLAPIHGTKTEPNKSSEVAFIDGRATGTDVNGGRRVTLMWRWRRPTSDRASPVASPSSSPSKRAMSPRSLRSKAMATRPTPN